jgi:RNA polymerase sigma factor (sigma-70 family)
MLTMDEVLRDARRAELLLELESLRAYLRSIAGQRLPDWVKQAGVGESDLVQDTFKSAIEAIEEDSGAINPETFRGYMRSILIHKILQTMRREGIRQHDRFESDFEPSAAERTPSSGAARREDGDLYDRALATLPEREQLVVRWHLDDGLSYAKIGDRLGVSGPGARGIFVRGGRQILEKMGVSLPPEEDGLR